MNGVKSFNKNVGMDWVGSLTSIKTDPINMKI